MRRRCMATNRESLHLFDQSKMGVKKCANVFVCVQTNEASNYNKWSLTVSVIGVFGADEDGDDVGDDVLPVIY